MPLETIEINSAKVIFDREKTKAHRTLFNEPCDCSDCINYRKKIKENTELAEFLDSFGIDHNRTEEVMIWEEDDGTVYYEAYYGVFGRLDGEESLIEKYGVKIRFLNKAMINHDRNGDFFWVCIEGNFSEF